MAVLLTAVLLVLALANATAVWIVGVLLVSGIWIAVHPFGWRVETTVIDNEAELSQVSNAYLGAYLVSVQSKNQHRFALLFFDEMADGVAWRNLVARLRFQSEK